MDNLASIQLLTQTLKDNLIRQTVLLVTKKAVKAMRKCKNE
jgi:hypothetical protein